MATDRPSFDGAELDGPTVVFDPVNADSVIRVPHPTLNVMNEIAKAREMIARQHDTDGKMDPHLFLLVYMGDAWLGTREMLRRLVSEDVAENDFEAAYAYLDIGFDNASLHGGEDAVESVSIDLIETMHHLWEAEDAQAEADGDVVLPEGGEATAERLAAFNADTDAPAMPETHVVVWALDGFDADTGESDHATYALEAEHLPVGMYIRRGAKREGVRCLVLAADNPVVTFARIYSSSITNMEVIQ